jgi:hypothetical protein
LAASAGVDKPLGCSIYQGLPSVQNGSRAVVAGLLIFIIIPIPFPPTVSTWAVPNLFFLAHMSMKIQPPELTVAEMLRLHRAWITMLFVEQNRTEAEIAQILYERNIIVSWVLPSLF